MSKGSIAITLGALLVIVCFFLTWVTVSLPLQVVTIDFTGQELAVGPKILGVRVMEPKAGLWVTFGCGIACLAAGAAALLGLIYRKLGAFIAAVLAVLGSVLLAISLSGGAEGSELAFGLILTIIGEVLVLGGAVVCFLEGDA